MTRNEEKMYDIIKSGVSLPSAFWSLDSYVSAKLGYDSQHSWNHDFQ